MSKISKTNENINIELTKLVKYFSFQTPEIDGAVRIDITNTFPAITEIEFDPSNIPDKVKQAIINKINNCKEEL